MIYIDQISNDTLQEHTILLPDNSSFILELYYVPMQYGWFINNLTYGEFVLKGQRLCSAPNIIHQFRNILPFGIACFTVSNREPMFQDDFSTQASQIFLLSKDEVTEYERYLSDQV